MMKINLSTKLVCAGCGLVMKDGAAYPVSHSLCPICKKISMDELAAYLKEEEQK